MEQWAAQPLYQDTVQFLCICVDNQEVAKGFGRMFQFQHVVNGYIPGRDYMPMGYGQLGCSGFVISNGQGYFVSKKTKAFLTYGESAFHDVERILRDLINVGKIGNGGRGKQEPLHESYPYSIGNVVILETAHDRPELSGKEVKILGFDTNLRQYRAEVCDRSKEIVHVMPCCLAPLPSKNQHAVTGREEQHATSQSKSSSHHDSITSDSSTGRITYPTSVGVDSMDEEHKGCVDAINAMLTALSGNEDTGATSVQLRKVLQELEEHFDHEELLMRKYSFEDQHEEGSNSDNKTKGSNFSALASHIADHVKILNMVRQELARVSNNEVGGDGSSIICTSGSCGQRYVNPDVAREIARSFVEHAENFDSLYSSRIPTHAA